MEVLLRLRRLGAVHVAIGDLEARPLRRVHGEPSGPGIERAEVEIPAILVGLAPVKDGYLQLDPSVVDARSQHAEGDVRRALPVVADRRTTQFLPTQTH